ncbi:MAG: ABC transporter ATP-binding protein [Granulosicoccus sp.]
MANVQLTNLNKSYGPVNVIPSLNLEVTDGEFVVLVGPSGCGKSTALRMIAGLETSTDGQIVINGTDVTHARPGLRNCAMVFQNYALYPHMTVADNICYGMKVRGESEQTRQEALMHVSGILGLTDLIHRRPKELSGGQRQRVAIGRALVRDPEVFLFDEPLSNLDAKLRVEMRAEIKKLHQRLQTTIIYVTHDQIEAMTLADRVVVMRAGKIEQAASPLELYESPSNRFVAGFIGAPSMNFLNANVSLVGENATLTIGEYSYKDLPELLNNKLLQHQSDQVVIGIRPEHINGLSSSTDEGIGLSVDAFETLGAYKLLLGHVNGDPFIAQVEAHNRTQPNQFVRLDVDLRKVHLFDPQTEVAL